MALFVNDFLNWEAIENPLQNYFIFLIILFTHFYILSNYLLSIYILDIYVNSKMNHLWDVQLTNAKNK